MCIRDSFYTLLDAYFVLGRPLPLLPSGVAVSYTHLDVYKRQLENLDTRRVEEKTKTKKKKTY